MEFALGQAAARPNAPMSLAQPIGLEALPTPALAGGAPSRCTLDTATDAPRTGTTVVTATLRDGPVYPLPHTITQPQSGGQ